MWYQILAALVKSVVRLPTQQRDKKGFLSPLYHEEVIPQSLY